MAKTAADVCAEIAGCCGKIDPDIMPTYLGILLCELVGQSAAPEFNASSGATPVTTATTTTLIADPGDAAQLQIRSIYAVNNGATATTVSFKEAGGTVRYTKYLVQGAEFSITLAPGEWVLTASTAFQMVTDAAGSIAWNVQYDSLAV